MTPATSLEARRDPFGAPATKTVDVQHAEQVRQAMEATVTPEMVGLSLGSTVIGPRRRIALINGKTFVEGQSIRCRKQGQEIVFVLVEVRPRQVILQREGNRFELSIPQKGLRDKMELSGSPK